MIVPTAIHTTLRPGPVGVMSDLHGNTFAVDAVLRDADTLGVQQWLILGDVVALGPDPAGVLSLLEGLDVVASIAGNTERYVLTGDRPPPTIEEVQQDPSLSSRFAEVAATFSWTNGFLAAVDLLAVLRSYIPACELVLPDGTGALAVHASLTSDEGIGITPDGDEQALREAFFGAKASLVLGGHTHQATDRLIGSQRFLNPGSVSNPRGQDKAAKYLVIHCSSTDHEIEHRSATYDVDDIRQQIQVSGNPCGEYLLRTHF